MSEPYRVIVVEDDLDVALYTKTVLEKRMGCVVLAISDPTLVRSSVAQFDPDVVITDIEMPGISGLDLIAQIHAEKEGTPVIVMTAHASVDYAVTALRYHASEFLTKPVSSADLVATVERVTAEARAVKANTKERETVLAIGAHPDDVEIGVGGILAAHRAAGDTVTILTLSKGSRDGGIRAAWTEGSAAAEVIGAQLILEDHPTAQVSSSEPTVGIIRRVVSDVNPTIVYVPSKNDSHQDHRAVHDAAMLATKSVRTVACYQSSTATVEFQPNRFVSIDGFIDSKVRMLDCFAPAGRRTRFLSAEFARATANYWARFGQGDSCEPLEIFRESTAVS